MVGFKKNKKGVIMRKHGLKRYRLKKIEADLLDLFYESRAGIPRLEDITFSVSSYSHIKEVQVHGFVHIGNDCHSFCDVGSLANCLEKAARNGKNKQILFQSFRNIL